MTLAGRNGGTKREWTEGLLGAVGLAEWRHHRLAQLSGGEQQRVAIAVALANSPQLVLADEPTGELDGITAREVLGLFRRIVREEHVTLVVVSRDLLVDEYVDCVLQLKDSQIVQQA